VKRIVTLVTGVSVAAGVAFYPAAAQYFNNLSLRKEISSYVRTVGGEYRQGPRNDELLAAAAAYNQRLGANLMRLTNEIQDTEYQSMLRVPGTARSDIMGYLEIPSISLRIPIFHGTTDDVLARGAGHLYGTSLPVGGPGTHSALSAHNGMPHAELFTGLPRVQVGDYFSIYVAGELLWYQVVRTDEVMPTDLNAINPEEGRDLVTLITCVPIGINDRRLLVTGERSGPPPAEVLAGFAPSWGFMMPWWAVWLVGVSGSTYLVGRFVVFRKDYAKALAAVSDGIADPSVEPTPSVGANETTDVATPSVEPVETTELATTLTTPAALAAQFCDPNFSLAPAPSVVGSVEPSRAPVETTVETPAQNSIAAIDPAILSILVADPVLVALDEFIPAPTRYGRHSRIAKPEVEMVSNVSPSVPDGNGGMLLSRKALRAAKEREL